MIILATGNPSAKVEGAQIAVTIPSGEDSVTIALDYHQAMTLGQFTVIAAREALEAQRFAPVPACAQIVAFPSKRVRRV